MSSSAADFISSGESVCLLISFVSDKSVRMAVLEIPDRKYNWMANYFSDRGHITRLQDTISLIAIINASIVQGSVIGPPSYIVVASDLHLRSALNCLMKYADDTHLLVGSNNISTAADEFAHINAWALTNNLQLNPSKTHEFVVSRRRLQTGSVSNLFLQGATRVTSLCVEELLSSCASSTHALRMLRSHEVNISSEVLRFIYMYCCHCMYSGSRTPARGAKFTSHRQMLTFH